MASCLLVEVVHVLRDYLHVKILLEFREDDMPCVGLSFLELGAQVVVEVGHKFGIAVPALNAGDIFYAVSFPQSAGISKSLEPAFRTYACTCENNKPFLFGHSKNFLPCICMYNYSGKLNDNTGTRKFIHGG